MSPRANTGAFRALRGAVAIHGRPENIALRPHAAGEALEQGGAFPRPPSNVLTIRLRDCRSTLACKDGRSENLPEPLSRSRVVSRPCGARLVR